MSSLLGFLNREEYIEQAYLFRVYRERLLENIPSQEILVSVQEEVLATTKLPMALDFLRGEMLLTGRISDGMQLLSHYFRPFQTYVMSQAENDKSRFDQRVALHVLQREAEYLVDHPSPAGLFVFQFECIAHNLLGYDGGMAAMAADPLFDDGWSDWILKIRLKLGSTDFADLIYYRSEHFVNERRRRTGRVDDRPGFPILFGEQEGRIAKANRGKDPLFMFAALQRQLGHPTIPRAQPQERKPIIHPLLEQRLKRIEKSLQILDSEMKGTFDLSDYYVKPPDISDIPEI